MGLTIQIESDLLDRTCATAILRFTVVTRYSAGTRFHRKEWRSALVRRFVSLLETFGFAPSRPYRREAWKSGDMTIPRLIKAMHTENYFVLAVDREGGPFGRRPWRRACCGCPQLCTRASFLSGTDITLFRSTECSHILAAVPWGGNTMEIPRRQFLHLAGGAAALPALSRIARAQAYPSRPVRIVVGFPPGGSNDTLARPMGQWLSQRLGRPFIVENRAGAGGNLATAAVVRAPADGYTLLLVGPALRPPQF